MLFIILSMFLFSSSLGAKDPEIEWVDRPLANTPRGERLLATKLQKELRHNQSTFSGPLALPSLTEADDLMIKETLISTLRAKVRRGEFADNKGLLQVWKCIQVFLGQRDDKVETFNKQMQEKGFARSLAIDPTCTQERFQRFGEDANFFSDEDFQKTRALQEETLE